MGAFMISGEGYFDAISQPVLATENNIVSYLNPSARNAFPVLQLGASVPEELPVEVDAAAVVTMEERHWMVRTFPTETGVLYQLTEQEESAITADEAYALSIGLKMNLNSMLTALSQLQNKLVDTELERNRDILAVLNHQYYKILHKVDNLSFYALSVGESQNLYLPETLNLNQACRGYWENLEALVRMSDHKLKLDTPKGALYVQGDPRLLDRLVTELCTNALKAGGDITLGLKREGERAVITVTDTGSSISDEALNRAFQTKTLHQGPYAMGVGFGLAICQEIARLHGGSLVISRREQGTQVTLSLPLCAKDTKDKLDDVKWKLVDGLDSTLVGMSDAIPVDCYDPAALY